MVENIEVYSVDSAITTLPQGFLVMEAGEMINQNYLPEDIVYRLNQLSANMSAYFMVDDLGHLQRGGRLSCAQKVIRDVFNIINHSYLLYDFVYRLNKLRSNMLVYFMVYDLGHLQRGGRLSGAQKVIGSVLNIKPVLHFTKGEIHPFEKIRSRKKALKRIFELLEQDALNKSIRKVAFIHSNNEAGAKELQKQFNDKHPTIETYISYFGPVIGTHLGEGAIGATWYYE